MASDTAAVSFKPPVQQESGTFRITEQVAKAWQETASKLPKLDEVQNFIATLKEGDAALARFSGKTIGQFLPEYDPKKIGEDLRDADAGKVRNYTQELTDKVVVAYARFASDSLASHRLTQKQVDLLAAKSTPASTLPKVGSIWLTFSFTDDNRNDGVVCYSGKRRLILHSAATPVYFPRELLANKQSGDSVLIPFFNKLVKINLPQLPKPMKTFGEYRFKAGNRAPSW